MQAPLLGMTVVCGGVGCCTDLLGAHNHSELRAAPELQTAFFNHVAHDHGFHPLSDAERWYEIRQADISSHKVCIAVGVGDC